MGCDRDSDSEERKDFSFNPRTHMGCDERDSERDSERFSFNPRTHMGCDRRRFRIQKIQIQFQSTHPHGVRRDSEDFRFRRDSVSIHAPTWGATSEDSDSEDSDSVSIHAPTWGATL